MLHLSLVLAVLAVVVMAAVAVYAAPRLTAPRRRLARPPAGTASRALTVLFTGLSAAAVLTTAAIGLGALGL